jgi:UPF0176 protein
MSDIVVDALYQFTRLDDPQALRGPLRAVCERAGARGTLLLAREGINGTIAASRSGIDAVLAHLRGLPGCAGLDVKESHAPRMPFKRMKVRLKKEIVSLGQAGVDPTREVGTYVEAKDWNDLIASGEVALIDTRNDYEVAIGSFEGAEDPGTQTFRDFPEWWEKNRDRFHNRPVAMFCTGGIRCEKASSFLLGQGVPEVYHLKGGILKYLEDVDARDSLWNGECYVFDGRVSVGHGLEPGPYGLCHACGRPLSEQARAQAGYERGVSCPACIGEYDKVRRERFRERQRQYDLAAERG